MNITSLENLDINTLYKSFDTAFFDYDMQLNAIEFENMLKRRGFNPKLSFGAFDGEELVSFTLNGIGMFNGLKTAYDTGTGTSKNYRGQGLATKIFEYSIPYLRMEKIKNYLLEVLQHNTKALSIYQKLGFTITREFNYFVWDTNKVIEENKDFQITLLNDVNYDSLEQLWDFNPSWQNSLESINRAKEHFTNLGVFKAKKLVGYCVFDAISGDIAHIAVDKTCRRRGIGSLLLQEMQKLNHNTKTKLINADTACDSIVDFLKAKSIAISGKQYEMIKEL
ncbi:GNAT family N-acetyltransferase [Sphingobacterium faecale]|uniref:GNAT family N-acetyltransferase n=1 Tax=Sphingobacterium faecale TaxID=2803775 RepID=A0ABS1R5E8_9SPHI|nr:GNAT family N-acetyltransferase [Sphingobacterium faecale]MBL1409925.1 GNAT family N-acetyltransferase [Sphingobacterium faecale]